MDIKTYSQKLQIFRTSDYMYSELQKLRELWTDVIS